MGKRYNLIKAEFYAKLRSEPGKAHANATDEELFPKWVTYAIYVNLLACESWRNN